MTTVALLLYVLGIVVTFWVMFIWAGSHCTLQSPSPPATALISLIAAAIWPLVLVGGIEIGALAFLMNLTPVRRAL